MFSDSSFNCVDITSTWSKQRITCENSCQTDSEIVKLDNSCQFDLPQSCATQTISFKEYVESMKSKSYDTQRVLQFVKTAAKITSNELQNPNRDKLNEILNELQTDGKREAILINKYFAEQLPQIQNDSIDSFEIWSLSWNSNASILCASYSVRHHTDWCTHDSFALLWNMYESNNSLSQPKLVLETDSCVTVISAHRTQPFIYAIGTISGNISIFNTRYHENYTQILSVRAHHSAVTNIHWLLSDKKSDNDILVSSGLDGRILSWNLQYNRKAMTISDSFAVTVQDLPKSFGIKRNKMEAEVGIREMSFNSEDQSIFIIGCHGGAIFQCSLNSKLSLTNQSDSLLSSNEKQKTTKSPIVLTYTAHRGHITALQFCPFSRNIFFSSGIDSELRIYNMLHTKPITIIHTDYPITSAEWSVCRPNIVVITDNGSVHIYSVNSTKMLKSEFSFSIGVNINAKILSYNHIDSNEQIAISVSNGEIQVWDIAKCTKHFDRNHLKHVFNAIIEQDV